jgi:hypothetical protein
MDAVFGRLPAVKQLFAWTQTNVWLQANVATEAPLTLKEYGIVPQCLSYCPSMRIETKA